MLQGRSVSGMDLAFEDYVNLGDLGTDGLDQYLRSVSPSEKISECHTMSADDSPLNELFNFCDSGFPSPTSSEKDSDSGNERRNSIHDVDAFSGEWFDQTSQDVPNQAVFEGSMSYASRDTHMQTTHECYEEEINDNRPQWSAEGKFARGFMCNPFPSPTTTPDAISQKPQNIYTTQPSYMEQGVSPNAGQPSQIVLPNTTVQQNNGGTQRIVVSPFLSSPVRPMTVQAENGKVIRLVPVGNPLVQKAPDCVVRSPNPCGREMSKEEERKMKNRHFAQISREKKKRENGELRAQVETLISEKRELARENGTLRQTIGALQQENAELRSRLGIISTSAPTSGRPSLFITKRTVRAAGTTLMAVALVCSLGFLNTSSNSAPIAELKRSSSRVLGVPSAPQADPVANLTAPEACFNSSIPQNETNFATVNTMITNWVQRHSYTLDKTVRWSQGARRVVDEQGGAPRTQSGERKRENAKLKAVRDRAWKHLDLLNSTTGAASPKTSNGDTTKPNDSAQASRTDLELPYRDLARLVKQRKDTLYLLNLQYVILPAEYNDPTAAPRLSLVLPSLSQNATGPDSLMLRVDCMVTATSLFVLPTDLVNVLK